MKKVSMILLLAFSVIVGAFAQQVRGTATIGPVPVTTPTAGLSQLEVQGNLLTQNSVVNATGIAATGSFSSSARWNSMGNLNITGATQVLNGFRTQTDGRGLAWGHSIPNAGQPNAGVVSNSFIEWIGNGSGVSAGNLNFNYAQSPSGALAARIPIFTMQPATTTIPSFNFAEKDALVGQLQSGAFGSFGVPDRWSATGQVVTPSFTTYGTRHQYEGNTYITGFLKSGTTLTAVEDFGSGTNIPINYRFRTFTNPLDPTSIKNVWQSSTKFSNIVLGRQDYDAVTSDPFYLSLFDGQASNASTQALSFGRAGIYATTDGKDEFGVDLQSYASIVGEVETPARDFGQSRFAIAGLTTGNANGNIYAGYFLGDALISGTLFNPSDKKFKKQVNDEINILEKLMQLKPKNYLFDVDKFGKMGFSKKLQHGLISQDVEQIFPELVQDVPAIGAAKDETYKAVNYLGLIPVLIKAIQEQQVEINSLKNELASSRTLVLSNKTTLPLEVENAAFSLSQNVPNPFNEATTISYTIPQNAGKAILAIFDLNGRMIMQYNLQQGKGQTKIQANQLPAGMYIYSIIASGQEVISKRMVIAR